MSNSQTIVAYGTLAHLKFIELLVLGLHCIRIEAKIHCISNRQIKSILFLFQKKKIKKKKITLFHTYCHPNAHKKMSYFSQQNNVNYLREQWINAAIIICQFRSLWLRLTFVWVALTVAWNVYCLNPRRSFQMVYNVWQIFNMHQVT